MKYIFLKIFYNFKFENIKKKKKFNRKYWDKVMITRFDFFLQKIFMISKLFIDK